MKTVSHAIVTLINKRNGEVESVGCSDDTNVIGNLVLNFIVRKGLQVTDVDVSVLREDADIVLAA